MKKVYKLLRFIISIEILAVLLLSELNIKIQSWVGNAIGTVIFLLPIQVLLYCLSRDQNMKTKTRIICKGVFWFILICFIGGGMATLLEKTMLK